MLALSLLDVKPVRNDSKFSSWKGARLVERFNSEEIDSRTLDSNSRYPLKASWISMNFMKLKVLSHFKLPNQHSLLTCCL